MFIPDFFDAVLKALKILCCFTLIFLTGGSTASSDILVLCQIKLLGKNERITKMTKKLYIKKEITERSPTPYYHSLITI